MDENSLQQQSSNNLDLLALSVPISWDGSDSVPAGDFTIPHVSVVGGAYPSHSPHTTTATSSGVLTNFWGDKDSLSPGLDPETQAILDEANRTSTYPDSVPSNLTPSAWSRLKAELRGLVPNPPSWLSNWSPFKGSSAASEDDDWEFDLHPKRKRTWSDLFSFDGPTKTMVGGYLLWQLVQFLKAAGEAGTEVAISDIQKRARSRIEANRQESSPGPALASLSKAVGDLTQLVSRIAESRSSSGSGGYGGHQPIDNSVPPPMPAQTPTPTLPESYWSRLAHGR